ncbi:MAG: PaaI family thioesterase [Sedimenticola sp.]|nr:PaaI family thioesterase [Sedimenticola sp.]
MTERDTSLFDRVMALKAAGDFAAISALIPYSSFVGFELLSEDDQLITILRCRPSNIGNTTIPAVHGGVVGALLEHAGVMHIIHDCEITRFPKIINISVDYLRPCLGTQDTYARAYLVKQGRSVSNVRVEAWQSDPLRPVAAAHAHFLMR